MKQLKKPTRAQKVLLKKKRMNPDDWFIERDTPEMMVLVHRHFNNTRKIIHKVVDE
jgi:hypothetical protein